MTLMPDPVPYIHKVKEELRFARLSDNQELTTYWEIELEKLRAEEKNNG
jgi:hypothetical protein